MQSTLKTKLLEEDLFLSPKMCVMIIKAKMHKCDQCCQDSLHHNRFTFILTIEFILIPGKLSRNTLAAYFQTMSEGLQNINEYCSSTCLSFNIKPSPTSRGRRFLPHNTYP